MSPMASDSATRRERCPQPDCTDKCGKSLAITAKRDDTEVYICHRCGWTGKSARTSPRQQAITGRPVVGKPKGDPGKVWRSTLPVRSHPYLETKGVGAYGVRQTGQWLVIPAVRGGQLYSVQRISPDGTKRFLKGCPIKGCYHLIGDPQRGERLWLCEGYATGANLFEWTKEPVVVAFDCGNLMAVATEILRAKLGFDLAIMADDDSQSPGNPGVTKALEVARASGARGMRPDWSGLDRGPKDTDFNDWVRLHGQN